jgi:predicted DNA-binding transcriptional regulator AlpA
VQTALTSRFHADAGTGRDTDRLLTVDEAAAVLSQSTDWLYRHAKQLPFTVRVGNLLRFSAHGIQAFIRQRRGRS